LKANFTFKENHISSVKNQHTSHHITCFITWCNKNTSKSNILKKRKYS